LSKMPPAIGLSTPANGRKQLRLEGLCCLKLQGRVVERELGNRLGVLVARPHGQHQAADGHSGGGCARCACGSRIASSR
jgi:hypothetical protein